MRNAKAWGISVGAHSIVILLGLLLMFYFPKAHTRESVMHYCEVNMENIESVDEVVPNSNKPKEVVEQKPKENIKEIAKTEKVIANAASNTPSLPQEQKQVQIKQSSVTDKKVEQSEQPPHKQPQKNTESEKRAFLAKLKKLISDSLIYPTTARRRGMEGDVFVSFVIHSGGRIDSVKVENGNQIFHQSAISAVSSARLEPPSDMYLPMDVTLTLTFNLKEANN